MSESVNLDVPIPAHYAGCLLLVVTTTLGVLIYWYVRRRQERWEVRRQKSTLLDGNGQTGSFKNSESLGDLAKRLANKERSFLNYLRALDRNDGDGNLVMHYPLECRSIDFYLENRQGNDVSKDNGQSSTNQVPTEEPPLSTCESSADKLSANSDIHSVVVPNP